MGTRMKGTAMVRKFEIRKTRKGDDFASLTLNLGREGAFANIDAKIWQFDGFQRSGRPLPEEGTIIAAQYQAEEYRGAPQWKIEDYDVLEGEARDAALEAFTPVSRIATEFYRARLEQLLGEADPEKVSARILMQVFDRADFREAFYAAPAAATRHQSYPGGLLEHTINVTSLALALADAYTAEDGLTINSMRLPVDRTLLIAAGLLHDIGKLETYRLAPMSETTDADIFEGHLSISYAMIRPLAEPYRQDPPYEGAGDEIDKMMNCILSHHGQLDYGSPVLPACVEAFLLSQADMADSRVASIVEMGRGAIEQNAKARWLRHPHFPRGVFIGDWPRS